MMNNRKAKMNLIMNNKFKTKTKTTVLDTI